jgi:hypothetical protein
MTPPQPSHCSSDGMRSHCVCHLGISRSLNTFTTMSTSTAAAASIRLCSRLACAVLLRQPAVPAAPWTSQSSHLNRVLSGGGAAAPGSSWRYCSSSSSSSTHHQHHTYGQQHHDQQYESEYSYYEDEPEQPLDKQQVLRDLLRKAHAAEVCVAVLCCVPRHKPRFIVSMLAC